MTSERVLRLETTDVHDFSDDLRGWRHNPASVSNAGVKASRVPISRARGRSRTVRSRGVRSDLRGDASDHPFERAEPKRDRIDILAFRQQPRLGIPGRVELVEMPTQWVGTPRSFSNEIFSMIHQ